jgi:hypothetical protein
MCMVRSVKIHALAPRCLWKSAQSAWKLIVSNETRSGGGDGRGQQTNQHGSRACDIEKHEGLKERRALERGTFVHEKR